MQGVDDQHRQDATEILLEHAGLRGVVDRLAEPLCLDFDDPARRGHDGIELFGFERGKHGAGSAARDPVHLVAEPARLENIGSINPGARADRGRRNDRLGAVRPLVGGELFDRSDSGIVKILAHHDVGDGGDHLGRKQNLAGLAACGQLQGMAGVAMGEGGLAGGQRLPPEGACVAGHELEFELFLFEVAFQVGDHTNGIDRRDRAEGERGEFIVGAQSRRQ